MPMYDWLCIHCGELFEAECSIEERDTRHLPCPHCKKGKGERVFNKKGPIRHISWSLWNDHNRVG